jgi:hypothetical protein
MGASSHHGFPYPDAGDPAKPRINITDLAQAVDAGVPLITYGTTSTPVDPSPREGDIYLQFVPGALAADIAVE